MLDDPDMKNEDSSKSKLGFQELSVSPVLITALDKMKITNPTAIQRQALPVAMAGNDIIAVAQTGSGKTLAYALSVLTTLEKKPSSRALILAPSREMAQQIFKVFTQLCEELPISTCLVIGGLPGAKQTSQLKKNPRLIVGTPGRMNDHLLTNKLLLQNVEVIVIDEADRMLDMGFAPQLKNIQSTLRGQRQTLMFSASFGQAVESIAKVFIKEKVSFIKTEQAEAPVATLKQKVIFIDYQKKDDRLLDELNATQGGVIVFTGNQENCVKVGRYLKEYGYATDLIHGELSQGHRNRVIREFREGKLRVVVATDLLARGLDVPHVDHVINFDLPFQGEDFLHRIGRTARAGRSGTAITFVTPSDFRKYNKIKPYLKDAQEIKVDSNFKFNENHSRFDSHTKTPKKSHSAKAQFSKNSVSKPLAAKPERPHPGKKKSHSRPFRK